MPRSPSTWNVPYRRNPFFTGREDVLKNLHEMLMAGKTAALTQPQAISGLGGIGKTQAAVEYAYRYGSEYQAVLWAKADTREVLIADFVSIADLLNLPEKNEQDENKVVNVVKRWLQTHTDWLLILDNVEDLEMVDEFVPQAGRGHILLTTRTQATGAANRVDIHKMEPEEGALFLLRRAKIINFSDADFARAKAISREMDGLPLALDQAGAYIEETRCGLARYLELYQTRHADLLKRRGRFVKDHPESVTTTFSLSFEKVQQANPASTDLLRLCAFLHPDDIPEEIMTEGASELGPVLQPITTNPIELEETIAELGKYSLIRRDPEAKTLSIHRLVQAVVKDGMDKEMQRQWAECTVRAVNRTLPVVEFNNWYRSQRCFPQALICTVLIEQWRMESIEAARLLNQTGHYLYEHAQYTQVESLLTQALAIRQKTLGSDHPDVAEGLNNLAVLYLAQGKYAQAEPLLTQALAIRQKTLGSDHPDVAEGLNNLAMLYHYQSKYVQAEPLHYRALIIREQALGAEHPDVIASLNNLAGLYHSQGKYTQAELFYQQALTICEQNLGQKHPLVATSLNNLAMLYAEQGIYDQAEQFYQQALTIFEQILGPDHPDVATTLNNLAEIYHVQGQYDKAELLCRRALAIHKQALGSENPDVATSLNNLAGLYHDQGQYDKAEPLYQQALVIWEQTVGPDHPHVAAVLNHLALLYYIQGKYNQAETLYRRAMTIYEQTLGLDHPHVANSLNNLAAAYAAQDKYSQAEALYRQALVIDEQALGVEHPHVAIVLENYADLLRKTKRETEAAELEARTKAIRAKHIQENIDQ